MIISSTCLSIYFVIIGLNITYSKLTKAKHIICVLSSIFFFDFLILNQDIGIRLIGICMLNIKMRKICFKIKIVKKPAERT